MSFSRIAIAVLIACGVLGAAWAALWAAWTVDIPSPGQRSRNWEHASADECRLMAQALLATGRNGKNPLPLMTRDPSSNSCDWSRWGLAVELITTSEFRAATSGDDPIANYLPHVRVAAPRYSLLRLRAAVVVDRAFGWESGVGEVCYFRRGLQHWRLQGCRMYSVS